MWEPTAASARLTAMKGPMSLALALVCVLAACAPAASGEDVRVADASSPSTGPASRSSSASDLTPAPTAAPDTECTGFEVEYGKEDGLPTRELAADSGFRQLGLSGDYEAVLNARGTTRRHGEVTGYVIVLELDDGTFVAVEGQSCI